MTLTLTAKTYDCEHVEFGVEDGEMVITFVGNFPAQDEMPLEEVNSIVNTPLFHDMLRLTYQQASLGTPVREAFDRMERDGGEARLRFRQPEVEVAA